MEDIVLAPALEHALLELWERLLRVYRSKSGHGREAYDGQVRRITMTTAGALVFLTAIGCGSDDAAETPSACLGPARAYVDALEAAPAQVRIGGVTPISGCLVEDQAPGAQATVGEAMIATATRLNREVRRDPAGPEATQLGYLVGAVQEGASRTAGIHADLVRRLDSAARYAGGGNSAFPASFERAFGEGYAAGQATG
jgi:hypothetical protein